MSHPENKSFLLAHNVKTSGNVAATFHIEPNHNPKAGETSRAWFALTKQGGELVPLAACNCQLKVYAASDPQKTPVGQPQLQAINAEQYQGIPGADVVFPKAGIYKLEISGTAKDSTSFQPFTLAYEVTVQQGAPVSKKMTQDEFHSQQSADFSWLAIVGLAIVSGAVFWWVSKKKPKS
jgi:hypothetical protein